MEATAILAELKKIIIDLMKIPGEMVVPEASFIDDLKADSLNLVETILEAEERFEANIPLDVEIKTVGDLVKAIAAVKTADVAKPQPPSLAPSERQAMAERIVGPCY